MILIHTNVLVYATMPGFPEHEQTRDLLAGFVAGRVHHCLTWINIFEYLRVVTHRRLVRPAPLGMDKALENIQALIAQPLISRIDPGPQHLETFAQVCREAYPVQGNFVHDCRIAAVMRENGVDRILTRNTSFRRITGITVGDPFA
ncbi:MAG: PIN domain-containing protein [Acidobacteria bacterium]|nr:PIN domain-containing protein [Acidobacteriota bacterium]